MSFNPLSGCLRCRITSQLAKNADSWLLRPSLASALPNLNYTTRRHRVDRAGGGSKSKSKHFNRGQGQGGKKPWGRRDAEPESHYQGAASLVYKPLTPPSLDADVDSPPALDSEHLYDFFLKRVTAFSTHSPTHDRLQGFGIPPQDVGRLLRAFAQTAQSGHFTTSPDTFAHYGLSRLGEGQPAGDQYAALAYGDKILTHACYKWAADPVVQAELRDKYNLSQPALDSITRLYDAADKSNLSEQFVEARRIRRKIIMHVGPTNSGKTFNALRALAAAKRGVYAGPLRLLAHEIWERLNLGEIPPLGAEIPEVLDGAKAKDRANPAHARLTNMITGEEQKIVDEFAPLLTCTVEMLSPIVRYDVAVIDEIQMIADPERGGGWTAAVLGLCADELHLCGEDTAIPLIEAIARMTGDELIINRYERLTPLVVEDKPLGKITNVQPGDCIVTFSRKGIFSVKDQIQEQTGMKCVVAYGMLPPEIRSEQAALFNDPDSGYDIIIGSDAIGMGLNLYVFFRFPVSLSFNDSSSHPGKSNGLSSKRPPSSTVGPTFLLPSPKSSKSPAALVVSGSTPPAASSPPSTPTTSPLSNAPSRRPSLPSLTPASTFLKKTSPASPPLSHPPSKHNTSSKPMRMLGTSTTAVEARCSSSKKWPRWGKWRRCWIRWDQISRSRTERRSWLRLFRGRTTMGCMWCRIS